MTILRPHYRCIVAATLRAAHAHDRASEVVGSVKFPVLLGRRAEKFNRAMALFPRLTDARKTALRRSRRPIRNAGGDWAGIVARTHPFAGRCRSAEGRGPEAIAKAK